MELGLTEYELQSIFVTSENHVYVGETGSGIICSTDNGNTWNELNIDMMIPVVFSLVSNSKEQIFAGSVGVFRSVEYTTDVDEAKSLIPATFCLEQNHPNPFNSETIISFRLPEMSAINLSIYDLKGRIVRTIANETRNSGIYRACWDGRDNNGLQAASGIYFSMLNVMTFDKRLYEKSIKMLLIK